MIALLIASLGAYLFCRAVALSADKPHVYKFWSHSALVFFVTFWVFAFLVIHRATS